MSPHPHHQRLVNALTVVLVVCFATVAIVATVAAVRWLL